MQYTTTLEYIGFLSTFINSVIVDGWENVCAIMSGFATPPISLIPSRVLLCRTLPQIWLVMVCWMDREVSETKTYRAKSDKHKAEKVLLQF